jgi:DNA polymerase-3 subunit alpha
MGLIQVDTIVVIDGSLDRSRGEPKLIANSMERIESVREKFQDEIQLKLDLNTDQVTEQDLQQMAELFKQHEGTSHVRFNIISKHAKRPFPMNVRKFVVDPSQDLLRGLRDIIGEEQVKLERVAQNGQ